MGSSINISCNSRSSSGNMSNGIDTRYLLSHTQVISYTTIYTFVIPLNIQDNWSTVRATAMWELMTF